MTNYFKLYKKVKNQLDMYERLRGTSFGIGARLMNKNDEYAELWQNYRMRLEIIEAKLENRNPNWFFAYYLDNLEKTKRNESYVA